MSDSLRMHGRRPDTEPAREGSAQPSGWPDVHPNSGAPGIGAGAHGAAGEFPVNGAFASPPAPSSVPRAASASWPSNALTRASGSSCCSIRRSHILVRLCAAMTPRGFHHASTDPAAANLFLLCHSTRGQRLEGWGVYDGPVVCVRSLPLPQTSHRAERITACAKQPVDRLFDDDCLLG